MKVAVIMGSSSDWKIMQESCNMLDYFEIPYEKQVVSAHRTPKMMVQFASEARESGIDIIIAGAGGAAHLPGMVASLTTLPVIECRLKQKFKGYRFFIINCSNARRYSGCNDCNWCSRC